MKKGDIEDALSIIADVSSLPRLCWGKSRLELARLLTSPEMLEEGNEGDDGEEDEGEDDDGTRSVASAASSRRSASSAASSRRLASEEGGDAIELADPATLNKLDTLLDIVEEPLEAMAHKLKPAKIRKLDADGRKARRIGLEACAEAHVGVGLLMHDVSMPYYAEKFVLKARALAAEAAEFERESAKLAKEEDKEREAREARAAADKAASNAAKFARDADAEDRYTYEETADAGPSTRPEEEEEEEEEEIKLTVQ